MDELKVCGKIYTTADESLVSTSAFVSDSLVSESLGVDTLTAVVKDYQLQVRLLAVDGMLAAADGGLLAASENDTGLKKYDYGEPVTYTRKGDLFGLFYLESITRVGPYDYKVQALSAVGLLLTDTYYGGVYAGISVADLVSDIIHGIFSYTIDPGLGAQPVFGWLKKSSRRDALRDVLFAMGGQIRKDSTGAVVIEPQKGLQPYALSADSVYQGGSVAGLSPATAIWLTEHTFVALPNDERITLFDGEAAAEAMVTPSGRSVVGVQVDFSEPIHDLKSARVEILESGANYAVLGPSSSAVLTGQKYTHIERRLTRENPTSGAPNVIPSNACTLVNLMNAENVLTRLMAYYGAASEIGADIVLTREKPGDAVTFTDPFGDPAEGYISELDVTMSGIMKARASIVTGYVPTAAGNYYQKSELITEDQEYTVPPDAKDKVRVVLCSGAQGGEDGAPGQPGEKGERSKNGAGGAGGEPGSPGAGGRLVVYTLPVRPGQKFSVRIGKGGRRGANGEKGALGGDTTFGNLSTASGVPSDSGYVDLITGKIYAATGQPGVKGGPGVGPDSAVREPVTAPDGTVYNPGADGEKSTLSSSYANGGCGGGAAVGEDGKPGTDGETSRDTSGEYAPIGGDGGKGADAQARTAETVPGTGGPGGHGGGGGGGGGGVYSPNGTFYEFPGPGGGPGDGGLAGDGADGFAIVYF